MKVLLRADDQAPNRQDGGHNGHIQKQQAKMKIAKP